MNQKTTNRPDDIVERVTCGDCGVFFGFIRKDGTGPIFDKCPLDRKDTQCPTAARLAAFQPKQRPVNTTGGGRSGPLDEDSGGYGAIARRALEDG